MLALLFKLFHCYIKLLNLKKIDFSVKCLYFSGNLNIKCWWMFPNFVLEWEYRELKPRLRSVINVLGSQHYLWFLRIISTSIRWRNSQHRTCDGFYPSPWGIPHAFFFLIGKRFSFFDWDLIFLNIDCHVLKEKMVPWKNFHRVP